MIKTTYRQWYTLRGTIKHLKTSTLLCIIRFFYWNRDYFFDVLFVLGGQILVVLYPFLFFFIKFHPFIVFMISLIRKNNDLLSKFCVNERNVYTFFYFLVSDRLNCLYYRISFFLLSLYMLVL